MKLTFCGAAGTVTGSSYLLETDGGSMLIDCGMFQGKKYLRDRNELDFDFDPALISALVLTHAHIDHTGLVPKLVKQGFKGVIYATQATIELIEILLYDSQKIQKGDAEWKNKKRVRQGLKPIVPLYDETDVKNTLNLLKKADYHEIFTPLKNIKASFKDAGHIMGSSFLQLEITENSYTKKIIFSGDIGRSNQAIINDPEVSTEADLVLLESTYGNRTHKLETDTDKEVLEILKEVIRTKGILLIPAFAVGRTQEMIYRFFELMENNKLPMVDIYVDSPMASRVTKIYEEHKDLYDAKALEYIKSGKNPLALPNLKFTESIDDSIRLNSLEGPMVIISASGMCDSGRILHHLKHHLWQPDTHVLFVGYQAEGTIGRQMIDGAKRVKINGESVEVKAKVHTVGGLSAHADRDELLAWLKFYKEADPQVILVHGEPDVCAEFSKTIEEKLNLKTLIPQWLDSSDMTFTKDTINIVLKRSTVSSKLDTEKDKWTTLVERINEKIGDAGSSDSNKKQKLEEFLRNITRTVEENEKNL